MLPWQIGFGGEILTIGNPFTVINWLWIWLIHWEPETRGDKLEVNWIKYSPGELKLKEGDTEVEVELLAKFHAGVPQFWGLVEVIFQVYDDVTPEQFEFNEVLLIETASGAQPVVAFGLNWAFTPGKTQIVLTIVSFVHAAFFTINFIVYVPGVLYVTVIEDDPLEEEVPKVPVKVLGAIIGEWTHHFE